MKQKSNLFTFVEVVGLMKSCDLKALASQKKSVNNSIFRCRRRDKSMENLHALLSHFFNQIRFVYIVSNGREKTLSHSKI